MSKKSLVRAKLRTEHTTLCTKRGRLKRLLPFFYYYGSKSGSASKYPKPRYDLIIEPFAGSAGYSTTYHNREILLADLNPDISSLWKFLTNACADDILSIPLVGKSDDVRTLVDNMANQLLVGFNLSRGEPFPLWQFSEHNWKFRSPERLNLWTYIRRARIAAQVKFINHWKSDFCDYRDVRNVRATWFIDPPYKNNKPYPNTPVIDYCDLADYCKSRKGQVIVCEQEGAEWLPFEYSHSSYGFTYKKKRYVSREVVWTKG